MLTALWPSHFLLGEASYYGPYSCSGHIVPRDCTSFVFQPSTSQWKTWEWRETGKTKITLVLGRNGCVVTKAHYLFKVNFLKTARNYWILVISGLVLLRKKVGKKRNIICWQRQLGHSLDNDLSFNQLPKTGLI